MIHGKPGPATDPAADRARSRAVAVLVTTVALAVVVLLGMTSCSPEMPAAESESPGPRVQATPTGLMLDDSPWWPIGLNAYQLGTDWSVNEGCGAEVDLDAYFAALPPHSLTRFNLYSSFVVDKYTGMLDFGPLDRVFQAAARHEQLVLPVLTGVSGVCEDDRFKDYAFYAGEWETRALTHGLTFADWVETAVTRWRDEKAVAGWELVGEPEASRCGVSCAWADRTCPHDATPVLRRFFDRAGAHLRQFDRERPIFAGLVGGDQCGLAGEGYAEVGRSTGIDVLDYHAYESVGDPDGGPQGSNLRARIEQGRELGKPLVVNEIGIEAGSCLSVTERARRFDAAITRQRASGTAGALLWSYVPDPRHQDCTYDIGPSDPVWKLLHESASRFSG